MEISKLFAEHPTSVGKIYALSLPGFQSQWQWIGNGLPADARQAWRGVESTVAPDRAQ
jgi:hypothetical protein